jgi:hypothetical protein
LAASTPDSLLIEKTADSLSLAGDHHHAALYYQKASWFISDKLQKTHLLIKASVEFNKLKNYKAAADILSAVDVANLPDSIVFNVKYKAAVASFLDRDFARAGSNLMQINYLVTDSALIYETYLLNALVLNEQFNWEAAQLKLLQLNHYLNPDAYLRRTNDSVITGMYARQNIPKIKSVNKAVKMSTFLPGLGQSYAGAPAEGLFSFMAIAACTGAMVYGIINQYYFTSIVLGNILIGKFYQGGLKRTEFLVEKKNYQRTNKFNFETRSRLIDVFKK